MNAKVPDGGEIAARQAAAVAEWCRALVAVPAASAPDAFLALVLEQCAQNYQLWN